MMIGPVLLGVLLRVVLYQYKLNDILSYRPELTTPVSSIHRVYEGCFLISSDKSPYLGDVFHQPPLVLAWYCPLIQKLSENVFYALWILNDVLIALMLMNICTRKQVQTYIGECPLSPLLTAKQLPMTIAMIYLLNPYTLASCLSMSTVSLTHLFLTSCLWASSYGKFPLACVFLSIASYLSIYPIVLIVPLLLQTKGQERYRMVLWTILSSVYLQGLSYVLMGHQFSYVHESYGWVMEYKDLTPNVGIFWYFFQEVFDRFRTYFLFVLHIHPVIYIVPLTIRLGHQPDILSHVLIGTFSLFQAYPSMGDLGYLMTLLAMHPNIVSFIPNRYVLTIGLTVGTVMLPIMWYLWLQPASGNANFYYNQTLVYQVFYTLMLTGFVKAMMKREKYFNHLVQTSSSGIKNE